MTVHDSVAGTGARPGEKVRCVKVLEDALSGVRYTAGAHYQVHQHLGKPVIHGNQHGRKIADKEHWLVPFAGYGALWERA